MNNRYPDSLKDLALKNVLHLGRSPSEVAIELDISRSTIYNWLKNERISSRTNKDKFIAARLENELQVVTHEREILATAIKILLRDQKTKVR